jgi:hypothetical protein
MKQLLKDFTHDLFRQLFGWSKPRQGKIILTRYTRERMREYGLDFETIEDVFRHAEGKGQKIVQRYANVIVGLYYKVEKSKIKTVRILLYNYHLLETEAILSMTNSRPCCEL